MPTFDGTLFRIESTGGWHFVEVPPAVALAPTHAWGRTPVRATIDGRSWDTSLWTERSGRCLLPVPAKIRRGRTAGDAVRVTIEPRIP
jgi:Domain of unknown function (DUF1905)